MYILKDKYSEVKLALDVNPGAFQHVYEGNMTVVDIVKTLKKQDFIDLFESAGLKANNGGLSVIDVLIVESDTWESLASDFNTNAQLIILINNEKELKPGNVIKVPKGN